MRRSSRVLLCVLLWVGCLLGVGTAHGAVFTVGPGGGHATVQAALNAAMAAPGNDEIRVHTGTYAENLSVVLPAGSVDEIDLHGGWNDGFSQAVGNPAATVINGGGLDSTLIVNAGGGALRVRGLTLRGGNGRSAGGGGVRARVDAGRLTILNCQLLNNLAHAGGGGFIQVSESGDFRLSDSVVKGNRADSATNAAGGGLYLSGEGNSLLTVERTRILQNRIRSNVAQRTGGGFYASLAGNAQVALEDVEVSNNRLEGTAVGVGSGGALWLFGNAKANVRRSRLLGNQDINTNNTGVEALSLISDQASQLTASDSLVAQGAVGRGTGVAAFAGTTGRLRMNNLTVVDSGRSGVVARELESGVVTIFNTLVFGHSTNLDAPANVQVGNNLIGVDPKFVDRAQRNYRLKTGSPAGNKGRNNPPGGLGKADLDGSARIKGARVDIGAYESL